MPRRFAGISTLNSIVTISLLILFVILAVISFLAVFFTAYIPIAPGEIPLDVSHFEFFLGDASFVAFFIPLLLLVFLFFTFRVLLPVIQKRSFCSLVVYLVVISLFVQIVLIAASSPNGIYPYPDSIRLDVLARALLSNDSAVFSDCIGGDTAPYLQWYPFQSGSVLTMALIYHIFGVGNQIAFQVISAIFNTLTAVSLLCICNELWGKGPATGVCFLILITCIPLFYSASFVYGNSIGLGFALVSLMLSMVAMNGREKMRSSRIRISAFIGSLLTISLSMIVKSTNILFMLGLVFGWTVFLLRRRLYFHLPIVVVVFFLLNSAPSLATNLLQSQTNTSFGEGMPKVSWIAMGLRDDGLSGVPGWWGPYPTQIYFETNGESGAQSAIACASILDSVNKFQSDPNYALRFFSKKLASEWADPTFMSLYYYGVGSSGVDTNDVPLLLTSVFTGFTSNRILTEVMEAHQWLVYLGSMLTISILLFRRTEREMLAKSAEMYFVAAFSFFAGFGCFLLWEAKSVYTFPFFLLLIPLSSLSISSIMNSNLFAIFSVSNRGQQVD